MPEKTPTKSPPSTSKVSTGRAWVDAMQAAARSEPSTPVTTPLRSILATPLASPVPPLSCSPEDPPLQKKWGVWFSGAPPAARRGVRTEPPPPKLIGSFASIVGMWRYLLNSKSPSHFQNDANIYFFEDGSEPFWEHKSNANGGRWLTTISDHQSADAKWDELCLAVFRNATQGIEDEVVGLIASHRRNYVRLSVWTRNKDSPVTREVGEFLKKEAGIEEFEYQAHGADYAKPLHALKGM